MNTLDMVREFHSAFGVKQEPIEDCRELRTELLSEELDELLLALGYLGCDEWADGYDLTEVLDALCDLQYILDGTFLAFGLASVKQEAMEEVHRSNMSKLGADWKPIYREDGKVLKGPNFTQPDLGPLVTKAKAHQGLDELSAQAQELDMGY